MRTAFLENGVPPVGWIDHRGLRFPGGMLAMIAASPVLLRVLRLPILSTLDCFAPAIALAIFVGRFGCFFHGCCYGHLTTVLWSVTYPLGSLPFINHLRRSLISSEATASLPVHPLALYFAVDALLIAGVLYWMARRARYPGQVALWFFFLRGWSKVLIELLREREMSLTVNRSGAVEVLPALLATLLLLAVAWKRFEEDSGRKTSRRDSR